MAIKAADQITITDITDAYSVILTSEAYTFVGGTGGAASGAKCTTQAVAFCGSNQCNSVSVNKDDIICPTGISASVSNSGSSAVTIEFTLTATLAAAAEATIPVVVDGITVNKKFSFAVAKTGQQGQKGDTGTAITGIASKFKLNNSTTAPTIDTTWSDTPSAPTSSNKYLWSYEIVTYSNNTTSNTAAHIVGTFGATGTAGSVWYTGTGITGTSTTATIFNGSGVSNAKVNDQYLNTETGNTYKCTVAGAPTAAKWVYTGNIKGLKGDTGDDGADAITLSVTSSNGTVFKNNSGSTVLTAHVYKAGVEQTIADNGTVANSLGTIKWYKVGTTTAVATAKTLTINASDVSNVQAYTCQLEG